MQVELDDSLPKLICLKCVNKAHNSYKFQLQCNKSQTLLDTYIAELEEISYEISKQNILLPSKQIDSQEIVIKNKENVADLQVMASTGDIFSNKDTYAESKSIKITDILASTETENNQSTEDNIMTSKVISKNEIIQKQDLQNTYKNVENTKNEMTEIRNIDTEDHFSDDFNSESDILSLTGEDILSTDDILKSLDLMSNVDNQEDLDIDEDEDCEDLKSCIPLGDETVDQLIKDNLQVDNLDLLTPKMESFNFNLVDEEIDNALDKSDIHQGNEISQLTQPNTEHVSVKHASKGSIESQHYYEKTSPQCQHSSEKPSQFKSVIEDQKIIFEHTSTTKSSNELLSNKTMSSVVPECKSISFTQQDKVSKNDSTSLTNFLKETLVEPVTINSVCNESKTDLDISKCSESILIKPISAVTSVKSPILHVDSTISYNKPLTTHSKYDYQSIKSESKSEIISIQNISNKPESLSLLKNDSNVEAPLVNQPEIISSSYISNTEIKECLSNETKTGISFKISSKDQIILPNSLTKPVAEFKVDSNELKKANNQPKTVPISFKIPSTKTILAKNSNAEPKTVSLALQNSTNKLTVVPITFKSNKLVVNTTSCPSTKSTFKHPLNDSRGSTLNNIIINKPNVETVPLKASTNTVQTELIPIKCSIGNKFQVETILSKVPTKTNTVESILLKTPSNIKATIGTISIKRPSIHSNIESNAFKRPSIQQITFKHPSIISHQLKHQTTKVSSHQQSEKSVQPTQLNNKLIQPPQPFRRLKTFSIKPREPPNMDYYKKEKEDNTVVSILFSYKSNDSTKKLNGILKNKFGSIYV